MVRKSWIGPPPVETAAVTALVRELSVPPAVARILVARGKTDPVEARRWLQRAWHQMPPGSWRDYLEREFKQEADRREAAREDRAAVLPQRGF